MRWCANGGDRHVALGVSLGVGSVDGGCGAGGRGFRLETAACARAKSMSFFLSSI